MQKHSFLLIFLLILSQKIVYGNDINIIDGQKSKFINEGFGFEYIDEEAEDINNFILKHGNPLNMDIENIESELGEYGIITLEYNKITVEELNAWPSSWQIITDDTKYLIEDRGTRPPPRNVVVKNIENKEIIFFGEYYEKINLQGHIIEIVKHYGEYYAEKWSINNTLDDNELDFGKVFLNENRPPEEWVRIADSAQGNGLALLIIFEYNFETKESRIIGGKYYRTM